MELVAKIVGVVVLAMLIAFGGAVICAAPVWLLWNWTMPVVFELPALTFWQAFRLTLIVGFLFGRIQHNKTS